MMSFMNKTWQKIKEDVLIVAEIGKNFIQTAEDRPVHEYLKNAKKLAKAAKDAGADAVKLQTHNVEDEQLKINVVAPHFNMDRYSWIKRNTDAMPLDEFIIPLKNYCDEIGITLFSTPVSRGAAKILNRVDFDVWKVASADLLDFVLLEYLASTEKPIILSSGLSTLDEMDKSVDFLKRRNADIALMHCVSVYPCPIEKLNLELIPFLIERYQIPVGFSDHSSSIEPSVIANSLGANIIEKHITLSHDFWGPDHKASILPSQLKELVNSVHNYGNNKKDLKISQEKLEVMLGKREKVLQEQEQDFRPIYRKSLMAGTEIKSGTKLEPAMIYAMRPQKHANGIHSEYYEEVVGKMVTEDLKKYDPITWNNLE